MHSKEPFSNCSSFTTRDGADEHYIALTPAASSNFKGDLDSLQAQYLNTLSRLGLSADTQVHSRLYLSDIANQSPTLKKSRLFRLLNKSACTIIQQNPLQGGRISLLSYHISFKSEALTKKQFQPEPGQEQNYLFLQGRHYGQLWTANFAGNGSLNSGRQTRNVLSTLDSVIHKNGMSMDSNLIRTWVFVRDIDNHYNGMVKARKAFYTKKGLTQKTHFPASTGIEGLGSNPGTLVSMDSLSYKGLKNGQIKKMEALKNLSPTIRYGVTFERGIKLMFGDRNHLYISGTASINHKGELLHPANLEKQTLRTLKNIRALLKPHRAGLKDIACAIAYVREPQAKRQVKAIMDSVLPQKLPLVLVEASVCRPGWLFELECVAITDAKGPYPCFI